MREIVECVPNFSEGRNREALGCTLLDVDPGRSTNRTVYTSTTWPG